MSTVRRATKPAVAAAPATCWKVVSAALPWEYSSWRRLPSPRDIIGVLMTAMPTLMRTWARTIVQAFVSASKVVITHIALENTIEGCVREAFGALVATHQAQHATDPELRAMFAAIAKDETEHAALSLDLADWIEPQLSRVERKALADARIEAFAEIERSIDDPSEDEATFGGWPSRATARALLDALRRLDLESAA